MLTELRRAALALTCLITACSFEARRADEIVSSYRCANDEVIRVYEDPGAGRIEVISEQARFVALHVPSASGVRYAQGEWALHTKGDTAIVLRHDRPLYSACERIR